MEISIITCVRDQNPELFRRCALSVQSQRRAIEWIVVDDGSTASAAAVHAAVVSSITSQVPRTFIPLKANVGLSAARNIALDIARGDWVVVLDSDDCLMEDLSDSLLTLPNSISLACFEVLYQNESESEHRSLKYFQKLFNTYGGSLLDPFLWYDFYYHGIFARRELLRTIGGYREELTVGEDQDILLRALEKLSLLEVGFVHKLGYRYRSNPNGVCGRRWAEVLVNYTKSMLDAAKRRGSPFIDCRFGGTEEIDGCLIDYYEYFCREGSWQNFHVAHRTHELS